MSLIFFLERKRIKKNCRKIRWYVEKPKESSCASLFCAVYFSLRKRKSGKNKVQRIRNPLGKWFFSTPSEPLPRPRTSP